MSAARRELQANLPRLEDTVPPPAGEEDAYSAPTKVGVLSTVALAEIFGPSSRSASIPVPVPVPVPVIEEAATVPPASGTRRVASAPPQPANLAAPQEVARRETPIHHPPAVGAAVHDAVASDVSPLPYASLDAVEVPAPAPSARRRVLVAAALITASLSAAAVLHVLFG